MNESFEIQYLVLDNGKSPFRDWIKSLDGTTRKRILQRFSRLENGNFGDCKKIDEDISELRFFFGSGYRVYFSQVENVVILIISGGDKNTQDQDINTAKQLLNKYKMENKNEVKTP